MRRKKLTPLAFFALVAKGYVVIIVAIIVVILAYILIWKIARILSALKPSGSNTNSTEYYYNTNSGGSALLQSSLNGLTSFTIFYGVNSSNSQPWVSVNNLIVTPPGVGNDLINNSNEYKSAINLGNQSIVYDWNAQTGALISQQTNYPYSVKIEKSLDLVNWSVVFVDTNCVPDAILSFTDPNATQPSAFYRLVK
jgi:hypothetical protein